MPISDVFSNNNSQVLLIEDISSQCNNARQLFTISNSFNATSIRIYWNGVRQSFTEITVESALTFSTAFTPSSGNSLVAEYYLA